MSNYKPQKNYLNFSEGFVMILTSKLMIISFIHNNTLKIKSQPIVCYSMEVIIYIGLWALEVKCTQYGIYEEVVFKNASAMIFLKSGRTGSNFRLDSEILKNKLCGLAQPDLTPLKVRGGV